MARDIRSITTRPCANPNWICPFIRATRLSFRGVFSRMVQLTVLSGKTAGAVLVARRFPFHIGRATEDNLRLEEAGVWDGHLQLGLKMPEGFLITVHERALAVANGEPFKQRILRNGDVIEIGSTRIRLAL